MGKFKTALAALSLSAVTLAFGAEAPAEGELGRLDWIAGSWTGSDSGVESEEHWIVAKGGLMLGLHRDLHPSGRVFFEYLRIEKTDRGIHYVPSPGGRQAVSFGLVEIGSGGSSSAIPTTTSRNGSSTGWSTTGRWGSASKGSGETASRGSRSGAGNEVSAGRSAAA